MRHLILIGLLAALPAFAQQQATQEVKLVTPDLFCKIEQFALQKGKSGPSPFKRCDSLKDKAESPVQSRSECKQRALSKGEECLKLSGGDDLAVTAKFIERFAVSFNSTTFTCALSKGAGNECP